MMLYGNYTIEYMKRVLVACEESQIVTKAFRELGHEAYSCDILPCSGGYPEWHFQQDVFEVIDNKDWDIIILHPPCTKVAVSGNAWYGSNKARHNERVESVKWIQSLWDKSISLCEKVAMENPVGVLNKMGNFPKPTYIQPWQFGHGETKKTGLWLKGLPNLKPTNIVEGREQRILNMPPSKDRRKLRSKTFPGIAKAIAEQWGNYA
jgi:site-specific DNA-cytosine methylase